MFTAMLVMWLPFFGVGATMGTTMDTCEGRTCMLQQQSIKETVAVVDALVELQASEPCSADCSSWFFSECLPGACERLGERGPQRCLTRVDTVPRCVAGCIVPETMQQATCLVASPTTPVPPAPEVGTTLAPSIPPSVPVAAGIPTTPRTTGTLAVYDAISGDIVDLIDSLPSTCNNDECPRGEFAGCILRFAGHDFMDYSGPSTRAGGSDGCVDFKDPDNKGLIECLVDGENGVRMSTVWDKYKDQVSFADFVVIVGEAAMNERRGDLQPPLNLRSQFRFGRSTTMNCEDQTHLPIVDHGCAEVDRTFIQQLGLSARGAAAMSGVHTLGRARLEHSGFDGWWSGPLQSQRFDNNYYLSLLLKGWAPEETDKGNHQWNRVGSGTIHHEMMLNTDICLAYGDVANDAKEQNCCAWIMPAAFNATSSKIPDGANKAVARLDEQTGHGKQWCGFGLSDHDVEDEEFRHVRNWCCVFDVKGPKSDCGNPSELEGMAATDILEFANDPAAWISEFRSAWKHATEVGREDQLFTPV